MSFSGSNLDLILTNSKSTAEGNLENERCPLCLDALENSRRSIVRHICRHMESIALASLPKNIDSDSDWESRNTSDSYGRGWNPGYQQVRLKSQFMENESKNEVIKCICNFQEDDGAIVLCEKCNTWQHIECYYYDSLDVPDTHECVACEPREFDVQKATERQRKKREENKSTLRTTIEDIEPVTSFPETLTDSENTTSSRNAKIGTTLKDELERRRFLRSHSPWSNFRSSSRHSQASSKTSEKDLRSKSLELLDGSKEKGRCPYPECGKPFRDAKAHMLTHQAERPEKCPIVTCEYHTKGFARKYDKQRHTMTHYKGIMVCDYCPGSGSSTEKSFNRADVFKRHLTAVHGAEQTPPNSRKVLGIESTLSISGKEGFPSGSAQPSASLRGTGSIGKCSICSNSFPRPQDVYEHLDECVLSVVCQEEPRAAINQDNLEPIQYDPAFQNSLEWNNLMKT